MAIDSRGFLPLEDVLNHRYFKSMHATAEDIFEAVKINDKKRFMIVRNEDDKGKNVGDKNDNGSDKNDNSKNAKGDGNVDAGNNNGADSIVDHNDNCDYCCCDSPIEVFDYDPKFHYKICALQGHSIASVTDNYGMVKLGKDELPAQIIHGTYYSKLAPIWRSGGLSRMSRNHIHFAEGLPRYMVSKDRRADDKIISGMRKNSSVIIYLDVEKLKKSELVFYRSGNGVILCKGDDRGIVGTQYFKKVTDVQGNEMSMEGIARWAESAGEQNNHGQ